MDGQRLEQLIHRLSSYSPWEVAVELAIIWIIVYLIFRFVRGTRGARMIKAVVFILLVMTLGIRLLSTENAFERLNFLYRNLLGFAALVVVIVFQPELRRGLTRLGEARLFRGAAGLRKAKVVESLVSAIDYMSKNKIGALIALERQVGLRNIIESGTRLDAAVSANLLNTIFWPGSALHDMGVVIRGQRIVAAGVQFPLAEDDDFNAELGSRHRAAIGLSQEADALILVVSEETGTISVAERGSLERGMTIEQLRRILTRGMTLGNLTDDASDANDNNSVSDTNGT